MTKFAGKPVNNPAFSNQQRALTHEGGLGYIRDPRSELFLQAVNEMVEDTYYESAIDRQARLTANIRSVIAEKGGWDWICNLVSWLRNEANMRSVSVLIAAEAVAAANLRPGIEGKSPRQLIDSACVRADEPAEVLGYWLSNHGRQIPAPVKRGVADAARRLYTERNALKYDGQSRGVRMGDVIDLVHPKPKDSTQSDLFRHLIDRRHNRDNDIPASLGVMLKDQELQSLPMDVRRDFLIHAVNAGWSWERLAGWLPGGMDASAWEAMIPNMGYMALIRNLRNFDQAGISPAMVKYVQDKLADPDEVARSRQFPYRFLSAHTSVESLNWGYALESALALSVQNVPRFESGRTLILVDTSGSMQSPVGGERSRAMRCDVAALYGAVVAERNRGNVDLAIYATGVAPFAIKQGASILRSIQDMQRMVGSVGHGTNTWQAIRSQYNGHNRIVVLTDEQSHDSGQNPGCWMHFINLAGYRVATAPKDRRTFAYGGFTDAMFRLLPTMEYAGSGRWPWE